MEKIRIVLMVMILVFIASCSPQNKLPPVPETAPIVTPIVISVREPWQEQWEKVIDLAKKEGDVTVYSALGSETITILRQNFKNKYGMGIEFIAGSGAEVSRKIIAERKAGIYLVDVYLGGATSAITVLKPAGIFDPIEPALILPEVKNAQNWLDGKLWFADRDHLILNFAALAPSPLALNTNQVRPEDIKSYWDLLQPRWKGKITILDPSVPGTGYSWFSAVGYFFMNLDYMRELAKQEPVVIRDRRLQVEWLAHGKYPIAVAPQSDNLGTFIKDGAPIKKHTPTEGTYKTAGTGRIALINNAPHPNASRLFINWMLSSEGQKSYSQANLIPSARIDVPTGHLDPDTIIRPGIEYFDADTEDLLLEMPKRVKIALEIFGPLMR